jgi:hypothetical protein
MQAKKTTVEQIRPTCEGKMAGVEDDWQAGIDEALAGLDDMLQDELDSEVEVEEGVEPTLLPPVQVLHDLLARAFGWLLVKQHHVLEYHTSRDASEI